MAGQLIFQLPTFHWPSKDQQTAFGEWKSHVTLALEASNVPKERWYASIIGFLGSEGFKHWQHLEISKDEDARKTPENVFTAFANTLEVSTSHWNYIKWNVQLHQTGRARNHWSARSMHQNIGREVRLYVSRWEDEMPNGATLPCDKTLRGEEVGKNADSSKWNSHLWQVITACKATRSNRQGLSMTQVQWRSCNVYHNQQDQNLHKKRPGILG